MGHLSYAGAMAAVLVVGVGGDWPDDPRASIGRTRSASRSRKRRPRPSPSEQMLSLQASTAAPALDIAAALSDRSARIRARWCPQPRYVIDARPVSYEPSSVVQFLGAGISRLGTVGCGAHASACAPAVCARTTMPDRMLGRHPAAGAGRSSKSAAAAVVRIEADGHATAALSGTGFFIDPNGTLYTSYTVGGESRDIVVAFRRARAIPRSRLISDLRSGIAILKIDAETPFLTFGNSRELAVASPVIAVGYPDGSAAHARLRHRRRLRSEISRAAISPPRTSAPISPCSAAKAARRCSICKGEVVGILISRLDARQRFLRPADRSRGKSARGFPPLPRSAPRLDRRACRKPSTTPCPAPPRGSRKSSPTRRRKRPACARATCSCKSALHDITSREDVLDASFSSLPTTTSARPRHARGSAKS